MDEFQTCPLLLFIGEGATRVGDIPLEYTKNTQYKSARQE